MSVIYFDSSAYVKLFVTELDSDTALDLWEGCDIAVSSRLAYPEVRAAIAAATRSHRITRSEQRRATARWVQCWADTRAVELTPQVADHAAELAAAFALGGADAVHLASALALTDSSVVLAAWDQRLREAALASGLRVAPAS